MSDIGLEILVIFLLVLLNGLFAMAEIAMVASRKFKLKQAARQGDRRAKIALELIASPDRFLSTVQIGITLIGVLAGAYGGATLASILADALRPTPLGAHATAISLGIVVLAITFLSLLLGELVPKNIALRYPEKITLVLAPLMRFIARATLPAVATLALCSRLVQKGLRLGPTVEPHMTEEELRHTIEQATQSGVLVKTEQQLLERTFSLGDRQVTAFMTPRTDVVWLDMNDPLETTWRTIRETDHTNLVVCREDLDEVVGVVHILRLWKDLNRSGENNLASLVKPPLFVPEKIPALRVLELMKNHDCHLIVVLDEYGGVSGLVSLRDLVTSVFFGSSTRVEPEEPMAVQREDGSWLLSGLMPIEEFASIFRLLESESTELDEYETLGGFVMNTIGKIPSVADSIERFGLRLEVVDMDGRRVDKVLVQRLVPLPETHGDEVSPPVASEEENEREE